MKPWRWMIGILGIVLLLISAWQIQDSARGLEEIHTQVGSLPLTFIGPAGAMNGSRPLVLIGHGFAGSGILMRGFALNFAHAGYVVALWDFAGHGSNPDPMSAATQIDGLLANAETTLAEAQKRGLADTSRLAILGHSMGSGVALMFGQKHPETAATIAVSPVGIQVTPALPRNLLLMAGELEPGFIANARQSLSQAGGPGGDPALGTGRKLLVVPWVEHITILFSPVARSAALEWLDATFGPQPGAQPFMDLRVVWYGLGILGTLLAATALTPRAEDAPGTSAISRPWWRRALALAGGAVGSTLIFWIANRLGVQLSMLLGLRVGGYVLLWFGLAGAIALTILGLRLPRPSGRAVLAGLLIFAALWVGVGLLGGMVWLPWLLIPQRLVLWPLGSPLLFLWFLALGEVCQQASPFGRLGWWLFESVGIVGSLLLALFLSPELGFLVLILPVAPVLLFLHIIPNLPQRARWTMALSGGLFVSWMLVAIFPLG